MYLHLRQRQPHTLLNTLQQKSFLLVEKKNLVELKKKKRRKEGGEREKEKFRNVNIQKKKRKTRNK